ncbi:Platelet-activating factor acetylhydrolase precursor, putative [Pediculus humanus corporis]|uniref:1-alkyl-2-acetylglycerophosphocholine esterase n=1 Tax=Pediculus humanus subsp. corporis TaxID=121224 RepID=E0VN92_PEDHC|nr:Platelet-activating factor acetylhydrolase precursor, putative [Pediculus humanus corporis]EEB14848.1 Platelet-activating factor acetylhydrolase precursor, putative [Pediculus humanus corporis]
MSPHAPGCVDIMTEYSRNGLFARIYYPTSLKDINKYSSAWISWLPHKQYIIGFAYVLNLWTFLIKLLMKFVAGDVKIPIIENGPVETEIRKFKTVVFSHGLGATRFFYTGICCELASHGYVVIALEHRDESSSMTYYYKSEEKLNKDERTWMKFKRVKVGTPEHLTERSRQVEQRSNECKRALTILENLNSGNDIGNILKSDFDLKQFKNRLDFTKPIMMGHSFGGATTLLTLGTDPRFKVGVILDPWMFPIKSHKNLSETVTQPLVIINSQTFHIPTNLKELGKYTNGDDRETYTIKHTTHENQSDTAHIIGYWLNIFMRKIKKVLATRINNGLILRFLNKHVVFHYAARGDQISVLKYFWPFLKNKTIPKTYFYSTPAHDASVFGSLKSLQWLIKYDEYQLLAKDIDGCNVLHLSAR